MRSPLCYLLIPLLCMSLHGFAQEKTVSGTVLDSDKKTPMQGVSVKIKGSSKGIQTNTAGFYSLAASKGAVLQFSFVGFATYEVTVGEATLVNVKLTATTGQLNEVVVTAYGISRARKSLGYSTPTVSGEDVSNTERESFVSGLAGRVPGLSVNPTSGNPGASSQIVLRGFVSIDQDNSPLIVVDGLPIDNSTFAQGALVSNGTSRNQDYTNRAMDINPADIESYVILKGPDATALYGNMGASGAILITTKKAKSGAGSLTYNNSFRIEKQFNFPEVQQVYSQGVSNGVAAGNTRNFFGPAYEPGLPIYDNIHNFFRTGFTQKHNLAMEGGNASASYRWSNEYSDNIGTIPNTQYTRFSSRLTATATVSPILSVTTTLNYINIFNRKANKGDKGYLMALLTFPSRYDVRKYQDSFGNRILNTSDIYGETDNPFWDVYKNINDDKTGRFLGNSTITLKPAKWLKISGTIGGDVSNTNGISVYHAQSYRGSGSSTVPTGGKIETYQQTIKVFNGSLTASANHNFGVFNNTYVVGASFNDYNATTNAQYGENMFDPNYYSINNTDPITRDNKLTITRYRGYGVFGQAILGYKTLVYLTLTGRMDGASRLNPNPAHFFYPGVSLAFNFSDLAAVKQLSWLTYGKIRGSFAYTGKEPTKTYATRSNLLSTSTTGGGFAYDLANGPNFKLKPEHSQNVEAGIELQFLNNRIGLDFTVYRLHSIEQILNTRLSYGSGYALKVMNGGDVINKGMEVQLTGTPVKQKNFSWDMVFNFTLNRGTVYKIANELPEFYNSDTWIQNGVRGAVYPGSSTGALGGWVNDRNDRGDVLITPTTGLPILKNGGGDFYVIGDRTPKFLLGFVNKLTYKNFYLTFLFDLRRGGDVYNATQYTLYTTGLSMKTLDRETPRVIKGVLKDGLENTAKPTVNKIAIMPYYNTNYYTSTTNGIAPEDFVEHDVNALRLRDVTLMYSVPQSWLSRVQFIKSLSVFATATDVFLITNYSGMDPDSNSNNPSTSGMGGYGIDLGNMGRPLGMNFGLKIKL